LQVKDELYVFSHEGTHVTRVAEDFVGTISIDGPGDEKQPWFFATLTSFTNPCRVARYDFAAPEDQRWNIFRTTKLQGLNPDDFETRQVCVWYLFIA
jgi:prolyl oligopeptidase